MRYRDRRGARAASRAPTREVILSRGRDRLAAAADAVRHRPGRPPARASASPSPSTCPASARTSRTTRTSSCIWEVDGARLARRRRQAQAAGRVAAAPQRAADLDGRRGVRVRPHAGPGLPAPDLQYHFAPAYFVDHGFEEFDGHAFTFGPVLVTPQEPRRSCACARADPADEAADPHQLAGRARGRRRRWSPACELAREIAADRAAAPRSSGRELYPGAGVADDADIEADVRRRVELLYHPVGTCRMGTGDDAVVDPAAARPRRRGAARGRRLGHAADPRRQHQRPDDHDRRARRGPDQAGWVGSIAWKTVLRRRRGIRLCYETFGDPADPPLLLIMGLGTQMVAWHEDFCGAARRARLPRHPLRQPRHRPLDAPRRRADADARGRSCCAVRPRPTARGHGGRRRRPARRPRHRGGARRRRVDGRHDRPDARRHAAASACSRSRRSCRRPAAAASGSRCYRVMPIFLKQAPRERDAFIEHTELLFKTIGSTGFDRDDAELREVAGLMFDRGLDPAGTSRQLAAIIASGNRTAGAAADHRADRRDPRHRRPPRPPLRRPRDRAGDPRREAREGRGDGPRPARAARGTRSSPRSSPTPGARASAGRKRQREPEGRAALARAARPRSCRRAPRRRGGRSPGRCRCPRSGPRRAGGGTAGRSARPPPARCRSRSRRTDTRTRCSPSGSAVTTTRRAPSVAELHRVGDQVLEDLREHRAVAHDVGQRLRARPSRRPRRSARPGSRSRARHDVVERHALVPGLSRCRRASRRAGRARARSSSGWR